MRGTWLDPFRNNDERKLEQRLLAEFEADVDDVLAKLDAGEPRGRGPAPQRGRNGQGLRAGEGGERGRGGESARDGAAAVQRAEGADGEGGMTVKGKTVVVTGAFGALGGAVAEAAAREGASVAALDFAATPPPGLDQRLGTDALLVGGIDLTFEQAADRAMAEVRNKFGRIDALLNIAGGFRWEPIAGAPTMRPGSACSQ